MRALVVFSRDTVDWVSRRYLHPEFKHCFAVIERDGFWIGIDSIDGRIAACPVADSEFDVATYYRGRGFKVVETQAYSRRFSGLIGLATCVTLTKRVIGCGSWALTPYQLYRYLTR